MVPVPANVINPPAGACVPGKTLLYGVVCDPSGEGYGTPDWIDASELGGFASIEGRSAILGAAVRVPCGCGPGGSSAAELVRLGAEIFKEGMAAASVKV